MFTLLCASRLFIYRIYTPYIYILVNILQRTFYNCEKYSTSIILLFIHFSIILYCHFLPTIMISFCKFIFSSVVEYKYFSKINILKVWFFICEYIYYVYINTLKNISFSHYLKTLFFYFRYFQF